MAWLSLLIFAVLSPAIVLAPVVLAVEEFYRNKFGNE